MKRRLLAIIVFFLLPLLLSPVYANAFQYSGRAFPIPWSGYWWPFKNGGLATGADYRGHPSPLEKYLLLTTGKTTGNAIDWYLKRYYNPDAEAWWGLCPAYARSAVKEAYPVFPSSQNNIVFRVGDKKGLLTLCHDDQSGIIYASGATPVDFHFWLLDYIGSRKISFTADLGSGGEVWYFPIYAFEMESVSSGMTEQVTTTIFYASDNVRPDYMGTAERQRIYKYTLNLDEEGNIIGGKWTGDSIADHPQTLSFPEVTGPLNPYLNNEMIRKIAQAKDDFLETADNKPVRLPPGAYNLVLLNTDEYIIKGDAGDDVLLEIARSEGSSEVMHLELLNDDGVMAWKHDLSEFGADARFQLTMEKPPYTLRITQNNYETDPNVYSLIMDFEGRYTRQVEYIPKNGPWSGFALTNGSDREAAEMLLVTMDSAGKPLQTVLGPLFLNPNEKKVVQFSDFPVRLHEYASTTSLKLISDLPIEMLNLFADDTGPMAGFSASATAGSRIVIPDLHANELGEPAFMRGALVNESFFDAEILCSVYSAKGAVVRTISQNIGPRGRLEILPGSFPFYHVVEGGWLEIIADNPESSMTGYQYTSYSGEGTKTLDTLFALPVERGPLYVQHITLPNGPWNTRLTLINPNRQNNTVTIHPAINLKDGGSDMVITLAPFEKQVVDLSTDFGRATNRSILEISGEYPLSGYVTYLAAGGDSAAYPLLTDDGFKPQLVMPHAAYGNGQWFTGVGVCNPNAFSVEVLAIPYNRDGQPMGDIAESLFLEPGAYEIFTVNQKFFNYAKEIAFLKFRTEEPDDTRIGGFYLIGNSATLYNPKSATLVSGGNM